MNRPRYLLLLIILLGFALRLPGLFGNTFHADEALFGSWARLIAVWRDPLLQSVGVDKPPLLFYVQAPFYQMVGNVAWAARLPNFVVSVWMVPLTAVLTTFLTRRRHPAAPLLAALLIACSPLAIQFSATAFTDPLMSFFVLLALYSAVASKQAKATLFTSRFPLLTGLGLGLAVATKYQAVLFLPLLVGLGGYRQGRAFFLPFTLGLSLPLTAVVGWEIARTGSFTLWSAQMSSYGGVRLAWSWELWPRFIAWLGLWASLLGVGWSKEQGARCKVYHSPCTMSHLQLIVIFLIGYALLHWLLAVPVWDRYLLPLVPLTAVGIGVVQGARGKIQGSRFKALHLAFIILLVGQGIFASQGWFALGSTPRSDQGAAEIAAILQDEPYGTVLYDHWYSWHWRYHFFDRGVYVSWFPHPAHLAEELHVFGGDGHNRYLVLPNNHTAVPLHRTVQEAGFTLQPIHEAEGMMLYQITMNKEQ